MNARPRLTAVVVIFLIALASGVRHEGFSRFSLTTDDVIFNPYGQQIRVTYIDASNSSINATIIDVNGDAEFGQLFEGAGRQYFRQCILLNDVYVRPTGMPVAEITWTDNPCIYAHKPTLYYVRIVSTTATTATMAWDTNLPADSQVAYRQDVGAEKIAASPGLVSEHEVTVRGLMPETKYFYRVISCSYANESNCTNSTEETFATNASTGFNAWGSRTLDYPLHRRSPITVEGFRIELVSSNSSSARITLAHDNTDVCAAYPDACYVEREPKANFTSATGVIISLKDASADTAIVAFVVPAAAKFPPAVIIRPYENPVALKKKTKVEINIFEVNVGGAIERANFSYEDGGAIRWGELSAGRNTPEISFGGEGSHTLTVYASNDAGYSTAVTKYISAVKPTVEAQAPVKPELIRNATPTQTPTLSAIEQVRKKLAGEQRPFNAWDYVPAAASVIGFAALVGTAYYFKKKRKPKGPAAAGTPAK
ncbi:MAG: hypothetical protein V1787_03980 [Candidatus Micrarchaeota archaeon]